MIVRIDGCKQELLSSSWGTGLVLIGRACFMAHAEEPTRTAPDLRPQSHKALRFQQSQSVQAARMPVTCVTSDDFPGSPGLAGAHGVRDSVGSSQFRHWGD